MFVIFPPKTIVLVYGPTPNKPLLDVLFSVVSVQLVPSQVSTLLTLAVVYPATAIAAVPVPFQEHCCLPVFKLFTSVQALPFQSSVSL